MTEQDQYKQGDLVRYKGETYLVGKQPLGYEGYAAHLVGLTDDGNYIKFDALQLVAKAEDIATIATLTADYQALLSELERVNGERKRLAEELLGSEWDISKPPFDDDTLRCQLCGNDEIEDHKADCPITLAQAQLKEQNDEHEQR